MNVRLTKVGDNTWTHGAFTIERKEWIMPFRCHSYLVMQNGQKIDDCETLREVRQVIQGLLEELS